MEEMLRLQEVFFFHISREMKRICSRMEIVKDGNSLLYGVNVLGKSV
jgi:hypothetical protein